MFLENAFEQTEKVLRCIILTYTCDGQPSITSPLDSITDILIKDTGRFCDNHASDILHDIARLKEAIELTSEEINTLNTEKDTRLTEYLFIGMREYGVDGKEFIESRLTEQKAIYGIAELQYRRIYGIKVEKYVDPYGAIEISIALKDIRRNIRQSDIIKDATV